MKTLFVIAVFVLGALGVIYLAPQGSKPDEVKLQQLIIDETDYGNWAANIAGRINDLSPTPPTDQFWTVREVEFVKGEPYAYVVYHDTHNAFRILLETVFPSDPSKAINNFRTVAVFEADRTGWKLAGGEDLAKGKETVKIKPN